MANRISVILDVVADGANRSLKSFRQSIQDADGAAGKMRAGVGSAFDSVKANAGTLAMAGGAALIGFGVKAVGAFQDTALAAGKLRDSLGVTAEEASRLMEVAEDLGIGTEVLEKSIGLMNRAATNTPDVFKAIGAELIKNADGTTNVNETFLSTIDALNKIPDASQRAAAAQKVFGRGWMQMAELIGLGADGVRDALDSVEGGKVIDDAEVERARKFRDKLDELKGTVEEVAIEVGGFLVPALTDAASALMGIKSAAEQADEGLGGIPGTLLKISGMGWDKLFPTSAADAISAIDKAMEDTAVSTDDMTGMLGAATDALEKSAYATRAAARESEGLTGASQAHVTALRAELAAQNASNLAKLAAIDSNLGYRNQVARTTQALNESNMVQADAARTDEERAQASRDAEGAVLAQAAAATQLAMDTAEARGQTLTANAQSQIYVAELERLAGVMTGPARAAIDGYIASLKMIPTSIYTNIGVTRSGDFTPMLSGRRASGGPVSAGGAYLVGEKGTEVLQMGSQGGNVIPNDAIVGGGQGGATYNFTINDASDPDRVVQAIRRFVRRNGPIQGIT